jgi:putative peptide zinc metalloprotease protein
MNLARVLEQSAGELPQVVLKQGPPRLHPRLVVREHQERDGKVYTLLIPGGRPPHYFRLNELQYQVVMLFDGDRTPEDVQRVAAMQLGTSLTAEEVRDFVGLLEKESFWYRTPQEESVALCQDLLEKRHRRLQHDYGDLSSIILVSFDPDRFLTWVNRHFGWIYSRWFTYWSLFMLLVAMIILGSHWQQVWADSVNFYNLTGRGFGHFLNFLAVFLVLGAMHEMAHGLTCKHYGGGVHRMGAMLVYLAPCVFCDVSQAWVYGDRWERMACVFWGVWSEVVLCTYASVVWWLTPPGTMVHQVAYLIVLSGGIFCVLLNWNPLAKMDGYMLMTEFFRINDVKVLATQWLITWIRVRIFRLPGMVQPLPAVRRVCYAVYAVLAGAYSYFLLLFFVRVTYNILHYYTPQWAFLPAWLLALRIFRSRILKLGHFMKELYLDKKDLLRAHGREIAVFAAALLLLLMVPLRRETVTERFVLEPVQRAVLRAQIPGRVIDIRLDEGERVQAGATLAVLRDLNMEGERARTAANLHVAEAQRFQAQLRYGDLGSAQQKLRDTETAHAVAGEKEQQLTVTSPIAGTVLTPRLHDLLGSRLDAGDNIAEVADTSSMRARIFVPEHEIRRLLHIHDVVLLMDSQWRSVAGTVLSISPASQPPDEGLYEATDYKGMKMPDFFVVTVAVANHKGEFRDGMTGQAKIRSERRSLLGVWLEPVVTAAARRVW